MNIKSIVKVFVISCAAAVSNMAAAGNVTIDNYGGAELTKSVFGVWGANQKVSFSESGTYSLKLTDFGGGSDGFMDGFDSLGAMISTSSENIASLVYDGASSKSKDYITFDIVGGDYWLSVFALTNSNTNYGTLGLQLMEGGVSPVPLPAPFWLMITSILGLVSFVRQHKAGLKNK